MPTSISEKLVHQVQQKSSAGNTVLAMIDTAQHGAQLTYLEFSPYYGLMVNNQPATLDFYRELEDFHFLDVPTPMTLH